MVRGVVGGPVQGGALHGHGAGDEEKSFDPRVRLESFVGQHPMETEGDAEGTDRIHRQEQGQVHPVHPAVPEKSNGADDPDDGEPDQGQKDQFG